MFDRVSSNELLEDILTQLSRTGFSEEHEAELPLSFTVPALAREVFGSEGQRSQAAVQQALNFLVSQGRVMARRHPAGLLYKLQIEGDTNWASNATPVAKRLFAEQSLETRQASFPPRRRRPSHSQFVRRGLTRSQAGAE